MFRFAQTGLLALLVVLPAPLARAHFIWVDGKPLADGRQQAHLYFAEEPEPGEPRLLSKLTQVQAWSRSASGIEEPLKLAAGDAQSDSLLLGAPRQAPGSVELVCDYGVYERGPTGLRLHYYAKHLSAAGLQDPKLARAERLKLDIVPKIGDDGASFEVRYQGQPVPKGDVVLIDSAGEHHEAQTNADGVATFKLASPGHCAVRAAYIEPQSSGTHQGKSYSQVWHYCTLMFELPASSAPTAKAEMSATEALAQARAGRAVWQEFPGFTADVTLCDGGEPVTGKVTIDENGTVELTMPQSKLADWAEEQLNSLVQHRMPEGEVNEGDVKYAEADDRHPLGRKIDLGDPELQSAYRIKGDVIMEVNRWMGPLRFTISVLEIERNAENKYLPRSFTMNFFDGKSGELKTSLAYWNSWQRVGRYDLPKTILEVGAARGQAGVKRIEFENCRLLEKAK